MSYDIEPENHGLRLLSVGRIAPVKNHDTLIEAGRILKERGIDFKVTMVGEISLDRDKHYVASIKEKIREFGLEDNFDFIGKVNHKDLPIQYRSHDIFIHLSKTGSLDKTVLEAMASGMRVLSSNDASRSFLPADLIFGDKNFKELADKIVIQSKPEPDNRLRDYVVKNHNLDKLIDKISGIITGF